MARRRSHWPALLILSAIAAAIYGATSIGWRDPSLPPTSPAAVGSPPAPLASVCVTRDGLCEAPAARAGDPCSCPHPLRGMARGHIERVGAAPALPRSSDWAEPEPAEELYDWEGLVGP